MKSTKTALEEIVGVEHVYDDPVVIEGYASDQSDAPRRSPHFVVRPKTAAQVQALVVWANETETPLVAVSSGPPHFHGDTVPSQPESVIVDLSRMNEIKRIDRRNKIALIEPGVTYAELEPELAAYGLRVSHPLLPRANKSVIASLLERQPTTIPRFNYSLPEPLRNCGVVWGTGEIAFTGEAGNGPLNLEDQWKRGVSQVDPKGPNATDLMRLVTGAQGTMGVVVWASVKCELLPASKHYVFVSGEKLEDLIDFCYKIERIRLGDEVMCVNAAQFASMLANGDGKWKDAKNALPEWTVIIGLAGAGLFPAERVQVQELDLGRIVQQCGLTLTHGLGNVNSAAVSQALDRCSQETYYKLRSKGACEEIFFLTTLDKAPGFLQTVFAIATRNDYEMSQLGVYIQPQHHGVSQHVEFSLPYDSQDSHETRRVKRLVAEASEALMRQGAYFSRPYGEWAEMVYKRDADSRRILRVVKQIVDPKNVMNPGKLCF
jgi:FAD/FMN-containing dehydrogenase